MKYRNLEKLRVLIKEATDLDVMYAYDDLLFAEHGAFIIQYDDTNEDSFFCFFHKDCNHEDSSNLFSNLSETFYKNECHLILKGEFDMNQKGEEVEIHFS